MYKYYTIILIFITFNSKAQLSISEWDQYLNDLKEVKVINETQIKNINNAFPDRLYQITLDRIWQYSDLYFQFDLKKYRNSNTEILLKELYVTLFKSFFPNLELKDFSLERKQQFYHSINAESVAKIDSNNFIRVKYKINDVKYTDAVLGFDEYIKFWSNLSQNDTLGLVQPSFMGVFFNEVFHNNNINQRAIAPYISQQDGIIRFLVVNENQIKKLYYPKKDIFSKSMYSENITNELSKLKSNGFEVKTEFIDETINKYKENSEAVVSKHLVLLNSIFPKKSENIWNLSSNPLNYKILIGKASSIADDSNTIKNWKDNSIELLGSEKANLKYNCSFNYKNKDYKFEIDSQINDLGMWTAKEKNNGKSIMQFIEKTFATPDKRFYITLDENDSELYMLFLTNTQKKWLDDNQYRFKL